LLGLGIIVSIVGQFGDLMLSSIKRDLGLKDTSKLIPGHGALATVDDLKKYLAFLKDTYAIVGAGVKTGQTLEQLKKEHVLAKYDNWAWDAITANDYVEVLYKDITHGKEGFRAH